MYGGGGGMGGMGGMSGQGGGMWRRVNATDERPQITLQLLRRVLGYARPYRRMIMGLLLIILITSGLALITPLIMRDLIDYTLPAHDIQRLIALALGLLIIPMISAALTVLQRQLNAAIG